MKQTIELLAPAGSIEAFYAAINSGADSVYVGGKSFGARAYSENFDNSQMKEIIKYAHNKGSKVYVTMNTIMKDSELIDALNYARFLYECGVDAIIVQDLGFMYLVKKYIPNLRINVSTQAAIYDSYGIEFFSSLDMNRYILARELSINEITKVREKTEKKIESFVHGALCMSYSGQCYFSSFLGGRSGNRGKCAQPCRLNYSFYDKSKNRVIDKLQATPVLSLKDFKSGDKIIELIKAGVTTFKIEGRMKNPEYTAIVVEYYRRVIDNYINGTNIDVSELEKKVESVFSRGFTSGYLTDMKEDMFAMKSSGSKGADIDDIIDEIKERINPFSRHRRVNISMTINIKKGKKISLTATDSKNTVTVYSDELVEESLKNPVTEDLIKEQLYKMGSSIFNLESLEINTDDNAFVRKSTLNLLRREATDKLYELAGKGNDISKLTVPTNKDLFKKSIANKKANPKISFKINYKSDIDAIDAAKIGRIYVPYDFDMELIKDIHSVEKYLWIPNIMNEKEYSKLSSELKTYDEIFDGVCVNNPGTFYFFQTNTKLKLHCGYFFNVINSYSTKMLQDKGAEGFTLSVESNTKDIEGICANAEIKSEIVAYAHIQLMCMKNCPFSIMKGCKSRGNCKICEYHDNYALKDRMNINFNIERENNVSRLYNSVPLTTISKTKDMLRYNIDYYLVDSKYVTDIKGVIDVLYKEINELDVSVDEYDILKENSFTRGHYFKNIL